MRTVIKSTAGLVILAILAGISGCMFYPISKKDVIGTYQTVLEDEIPGLPDGGSEVLELREDGTCIQKVSLKDGRTFSAQGTWEWRSDGRVIIMGIYDILDLEDKIRTDIEKTMGMLHSYSVYRNLIGVVALGTREAPHYNKKW